MAKYIQLYLDTDFIIPIGVGDSGNINKYIDQQASRRLWLFFSRTSSNAMFESAEINKANYEAGRDGFFGDFWKHIENDDNVPGESYKYIDLLDLSRIITKLREWSNATIFTESPEVVLNFSTVISLKARKAFSKYIEEKLGKVRSYSIEINDLLSSKVITDYQSMSPVFGDQLLIIQSAGKDILLSAQTWCGDCFMQGDEPVLLKKKGNDFLKEALVKIVVDNFEKSYHMLIPEQLEKEYAYQMQFTDVWLEGRKGDDNFWVDNFHYSNNPSKVYPPIQIDGKQLNLIEKNAIRDTINDISKFYRNNIVNRHLHTIFAGDVFKEDVFFKDCVSVTSSDSKYTYFNDNAIQEALGRYNVNFSTFEENLSNLERIFMDKANERERIKTYVHNAEILGSLRDEVATAEKKINFAIDSVNERNADLNSSWESLMKQSKFGEASELIEKMLTSDELIISKNETIEVLKKVESKNSLLIELMQLKDVQPVVDSIRKGEKTLRNCITKADDLKNLPETLRKNVQKYKDLYPKYLELKKKITSDCSLAVKFRIVEEMKSLTMEELPIIQTSKVSVKLSAEITSEGGFLGFGQKKKMHLKIDFKDKQIKFKCIVLMYSDSNIVSTQDRDNAFVDDINEDGEMLTGVVEREYDLSSMPTLSNFNPKAKSITIKLWPHESELIGINNAFDGNTLTVKL